MATYDVRDLDNVTRDYMLAEFESEFSGGSLYESAVVKPSRRAGYSEVADFVRSREGVEGPLRPRPSVFAEYGGVPPRAER